MSNRKFLFFYLNTGAGHRAAANVLAEAMKELSPGVEIKKAQRIPQPSPRLFTF